MNHDGLVGLAVIITVGFFAVVGMINAKPPRRADKFAALSFPLPGVADALAAAKGFTPGQAARLEHEFRRWFAAAAASPVLVGMCSPDVDAFWHELLKQPDLYDQFSHAVCGRLVQHVEHVGGERLDARCWAAYQAAWGEYPPEDLWGPKPSPDALARIKVRADRGRDAQSGGDSGVLTLSMSDGYSHDASCDAGSGHDGDCGHGGSHGCGGHGCGGH